MNRNIDYLKAYRSTNSNSELIELIRESSGFEGNIQGGLESDVNDSGYQ
ncbi:hypothetical protein AVEN_203357-1, partial [Araneus ventricosus]